MAFSGFNSQESEFQENLFGMKQLANSGIKALKESLTNFIFFDGLKNLTSAFCVCADI